MGRETRRERGDRAELAVVDYLTLEGYVVLGRNVRVGSLEIDVVARRGPVAIVVEVRTRGEGAYEPALASITREKQARILRAADHVWRTRLMHLPGIERLRLDVAAVTFEGDATRVEYIAGAFTA